MFPKTNLLLHVDILCLLELIYIWWFLTNVSFYLGMWRTVCLLRSLTTKFFFPVWRSCSLESNFYRCL